METTTTISEAYQQYHAAGFACVPTSKLKSPAVPKGSKICGNWENPDDYKKAHGIGLICGPDSGGLECLDFDNHFGDADKILDEFMLSPDVTQIYEKNRFAVQSTVSGGFHVIYKCSNVNGSEKLASRINDKGRPDAIIESRGTGNYFCCDPTPGYKIKLNDICSIPTLTTEDRDVLFSVCRSFNKVADIHKKSTTEEDKDKAGDLYNQDPGSIEEMKQALKDKGWIDLGEGRWRRPGKDKGISATLGTAAAGLFYNFSANGDPFEMNYVYSAFQVVALLKYGGDYKGFAKEIYEKQKPLQKSKSNSNIPDRNNGTKMGDLLIAKPANQWIKEASLRPITNMLFDQFWREGELCIGFGTSGNGKSIEAVQIGNSIASGIPLHGFKMEAKPQVVLYFDFELSDKQFEERYKNKEDGNHFCFHGNFIRVEIDPEADLPDKMTFEEFLINSIERCITEYNAKVLIVDNITYLCADSEKAKEALPLLRRLKKLKTKYNLSMLALGHTPKRDESKPINKNDLFGSSMIYNFIDTCFAVGKSTSDESLRYIKQIKERCTAKVYDIDNVIVCQVEKIGASLQLTFLGFGSETDYLKTVSVNEKQEKKEMCQQRYRENVPITDIAKEFHLTRATVYKYIKK